MEKKFDEKRVLFLINDYSFFLTHRQAVARKLLEQGAEVFVVAPKETLRDPALLSDFRIAYSPLTRWGRNPLQELRALSQLTRLYARLKPDLVDQMTIKPVLLGSIAAKLTGIPCVINYISGLGFIFLAKGFLASLRRLVVRMLYRIALKGKNTKTIFENPEDRTSFVERGLVAEEQTVIIRGSGVNAELFFSPVSSPSRAQLIVLMIARVLVDKGVREFAAAAELAKQKQLPLTFQLVGDHPRGNPAVIPAAELDRWQRDRILDYLGRRADIAELIKNADIVCLPSYREGLPRALVEGAAAGKALIASDVTGCREIVIHRQTGLLVVPKSGIELFRAIEELLNHSQLREELGRNARLHFLEGGFEESVVVQKTLKLYSRSFESQNND